MTTLIHKETGQSVTFDDATNFLAEIADPHNWLVEAEAIVEAVKEEIAEVVVEVETFFTTDAAAPDLLLADDTVPAADDTIEVPATPTEEAQ